MDPDHNNSHVAAECLKRKNNEVLPFQSAAFIVIIAYYLPIIVDILTEVSTFILSKKSQLLSISLEFQRHIYESNSILLLFQNGAGEKRHMLRVILQ